MPKYSKHTLFCPAYFLLLCDYYDVVKNMLCCSLKHGYFKKVYVKFSNCQGSFLSFVLLNIYIFQQKDITMEITIFLRICNQVSLQRKLYSRCKTFGIRLPALFRKGDINLYITDYDIESYTLWQIIIIIIFNFKIHHTLFLFLLTVMQYTLQNTVLNTWILGSLNVLH